MVALGFLNQSNAPTEEVKAVLPTDLVKNLSQDIVDKTVIFFTMSQHFKALMTKAPTGVKKVLPL